MAQLKAILLRTQSLLQKRWPLLAAVIGGMAIGATLLVGSLHSAQCNASRAELASRLNELDNAYLAVAAQATSEIEACQSVTCEQPAKIEVAGALRSYNDGLGSICWPGPYSAAVRGLSNANAVMAHAYLNWSEAATPADDQQLQGPAGVAQSQRDVARVALQHAAGN